MRFGWLFIVFAFLVNLMDADIPNPLVFQRADPWIRKEGDLYYFVATVPAYDRIEMRVAQSLTGLGKAEPKVIWKRHASGPMSWHIWAPELHRIDGKWYIYFAAGRAEDIWAIRMYVLENEKDNPMEGSWRECGQIKTPWDTFSLDATTFAHAGKRYLAWAQHRPGMEGDTVIYIAEMDTPWSICTEPVQLTEPEFDWEKRLYSVNEGPAFIRNEEHLFLTYSASGTNQYYCMGLLSTTADADLLDANAWTKADRPVFKSSPENGIYGPGHNGFTVDASGQPMLVYHARSYEVIEGDPLEDPNRHTRVQPFNWDANGRPVFGEPRQDSRSTTEPDAGKILSN